MIKMRSKVTGKEIEFTQEKWNDMVAHRRDIHFDPVVETKPPTKLKEYEGHSNDTDNEGDRGNATLEAPRRSKKVQKESTTDAIRSDSGSPKKRGRKPKKQKEESI